MNFRWVGRVGLAATLAVLLLGARQSSVTEVYTAELVRTVGLRQESVNLELHIRAFAEQTDADALQEIYDADGSDGLMTALREGDWGEARVTGGIPRRIGWVRVYPGENGSTIVLVTAKPLYFPGDEPPGDPAGPVGVIHLQLNDRGHGLGRLAQAVKIDVTPEGTLEIQATTSAPIEMKGVQRRQ